MRIGSGGTIHGWTSRMSSPRRRYQSSARRMKLLWNSRKSVPYPGGGFRALTDMRA
jgi:hypothetical protein